MSIKPIETDYKGYRFRSRLEARWAVFFTELELEWQYEPEGFELGGGLRYLPDFYLPEAGCWAEVKPKPLNAKEERKVKLLVEGNHEPCLLLVGPPALQPYEAWIWRRNRLIKAEYVLFPNRLCPIDLPLHTGAFGPKYTNAVRAARQVRFNNQETFLSILLPSYLTHAFSLALDTILLRKEKATSLPEFTFWQSLHCWLERFIPT